ncbi:MAG TPA: NgoFVII family restriction endonuclease [Desulfobacterales bacterium]|nr:NgoFVII family restriction endonuclease [Desulfobacterales bacterium]
MPRIFDNIETSLLSALRESLELSDHADFCIGYFNLRGWKELDSYIEAWSGGEGHCCRLLVGMQRLAEEELRMAMRLARRDTGMDNQTALHLKKKLAEEFREQLAVGVPTNEDEAGLRRLATQIKAKKVIVKLFLRHPLHAKLYLLFRPDPVNPTTGYLGSSNLTFSGLSSQGELNVDVLDHDACKKLAKWFEDRWNDRWCIDISDELVRIIGESWAREEPIPPYYIYIKMAYHLSQEARAGLSEFRIPREFGEKLFEFQKAAVKIAAHHINKRGGVLIGDVVGLGKTLMATAVARILEDDLGLETLIICPKNLVDMWKDYRDQYRLRARVLSISQVISKLADLRRFRLVIIDESHNLRNREGKRYRAIQEYIDENESKIILLSATPYNKTYLDLSNQLRLFVPEDKELSIRPEQLLRDMGETEFMLQYQCPLRSLAAFEKSEYADDWRELMRLFLVRRTRSFIQENYAQTDEDGRKYLTFEDGKRSYFPLRVPKTVKFKIDDSDSDDQYARLYASDVVDTINSLRLPRYGLGNYVKEAYREPPTQSEAKVLQDLSRAGKRLMGFCRTNLFKRLESSGQAFILSIERHILRNYIYLCAIEEGKPLPIGTQDAALLDARVYDEDADATSITPSLFDDEDSASGGNAVSKGALNSGEDFKARAAQIYTEYALVYKNRFRWLRPELFSKALVKDLQDDVNALLNILRKCGNWDSSKDTKLEALYGLMHEKHPDEKVIVFTQFADTVKYLETQLKLMGVSRLAGVTGDSADPTTLAWRFSPESNEKRGRIRPEDELRVLIATDVLSEGQNLQDCFIVVNYDLPWAIIRLVQRAGRVDRIGQKAENILCYSFLPAEGVERIIRLRSRVRARLQENAEVVGTDEAFFEDDQNDQAVLDLYNEKAGILDGDADTEVDLASYAYQIWKNATEADPKLKKIISSMPSVVYSTKEHKPGPNKPEGVLVYMRTGEGNDALAWIDREGKSVTESQFEILRAAECKPVTPPIPRLENHHELVKKGVELIVEEERSIGGQLGRPSSARFRTYQRLKDYAKKLEGTLFESKELLRAIEDIYRYPLRQSAIDTLNRQLRSGISDEMLAQLVVALRDEDRLCLVHEEDGEVREPKIICSMGLAKPPREI